MVYICNICGKEFDSKQKLGGHKNSHRIYNNPIIVCDICGCECKGSQALSQHKTRLHSSNDKRYFNEFDKSRDDLFCRYCKKQCRSRNSLINHERMCPQNPDKSFREKFNTVGYDAWNKGLTKFTDERVSKYCDSMSLYYQTHSGAFLGRKHTEETKNKISNSRKKYLSEHPDKVPYLLNHSSNKSYPETYFEQVFVDENIPLKYHLQVSKYELDFYNEDYKIDVEIDGEQHYLDKRIFESDKERNAYLESLGWTVFRIRWSEYKQLPLESKRSVIEDIRKLFDGSIVQKD